MVELILITLGFIAGVFGSLLGLGGGIIIVPALLEMSHFSERMSVITPSVAVGTSLILIFLGSLSSTLLYVKQRRIDFKRGILFFIGCSPGALLGAYLSLFVQVESFYIGFGIMVLLLSLMLELKKRISVDIPKDLKLHQGLAFVISLTVGILSGFFGIGGGILLLPFMLFSGFPIHMATSTSVFTIFLSSFTGAVTHLFLGDVHWPAVFLLGPGMMIGGVTGAWLSCKLRSRVLLLTFRMLLFVIAVHFLYKGLSS